MAVDVFLDGPLRSVAQKLIGLFTTNKVTLSDGAFVYDEATDTMTAGGASEAVPATMPLNYEQREIDGTLVRTEDCYFFVADLDLTSEVNQGWALLHLTNRYRVVSVIRYWSGNNIAFYKVQCRQ